MSDLTKHQVEYLQASTTADAQFEMALPAGPWARRRLTAYYSKGCWIRGRVEESGQSMVLAQFCALPPRGDATLTIDVRDYLRHIALEICAQIDGQTWAQRQELIRTQAKAGE